jgi:hypothetical protein
MARDDWVALVAERSAEYLAAQELERFGLCPYLPQLRRRWVHPHIRVPVMRRYPLFPGYLLLPIKAVDAPVVRVCRGLRRVKPILCDAEGRLWRAPGRVIEAVREAEARGTFDEVLQAGDPVKLTGAVLAGVSAVLAGSPAARRVTVLLGLLGGVKASVPQADIARA